MSKGRRLQQRKRIIWLAPVLLLLLPVHARAQRASAKGVLTLQDDSVGTGITYDIITHSLTAVFLNGQPGDQASIVHSNNPAGGSIPFAGNTASDVITLSTQNYQLGDSHSGSAGGAPGNGRPGDVLILAQFN